MNNQEVNKKEETKQCDIHVVVKRYFITKNRWNNYEFLSEGAYEKKLIFG